MLFDRSEIAEFIEENDVKFVKLAFCDIFGNQKNISLPSSELVRAFNDGISFDASAVAGFGDESMSDLMLVPDETTVTSLPWRPSHGRVVRFFCNVMKPNGVPFELDSRKILKDQVTKAAKLGYTFNIGSECEFYLFKTDDAGKSTGEPFDDAGYLDTAPEDNGENIRREICLTLEEMNIFPERSHHEGGPGQNEIDFKYSDPLTSADNIITFKSVVKTAAARNGAFADFSPKPIKNQSGNGFHVNLSIMRNGIRVTESDFMSAIAGIMARVAEFTLFLNPLEKSYARLGSFKAPSYITWSEQNRSQLIRIPATEPKHSRLELRSPDPMLNPYLAYALIIAAAVEGIETERKAPVAQNINLFTASSQQIKELPRLPESRETASKCVRNSKFVTSVIPKRIVEEYLK